MVQRRAVRVAEVRARADKRREAAASAARLSARVSRLSGEVLAWRAEGLGSSSVRPVSGRSRRSASGARPLVPVERRGDKDRTETALQLRIARAVGLGSGDTSAAFVESTPKRDTRRVRQVWIAGAGGESVGRWMDKDGQWHQYTARGAARRFVASGDWAAGLSARVLRRRAAVEGLDFGWQARRWLDGLAAAAARRVGGRTVSDSSREEAAAAARAAVLSLPWVVRRGAAGLCLLASQGVERGALSGWEWRTERGVVRRVAVGPRVGAGALARAVWVIACRAAIRALRGADRCGVTGSEDDLATLRRHDWSAVMGSGSESVVGRQSAPVRALVPMLCDVAGRSHTPLVIGWGSAPVEGDEPTGGELAARVERVRERVRIAAGEAEATARRAAAARWCGHAGGVAERAAGRAAAAVRARAAALTEFGVALALGASLSDAAAAAGWSLEERAGRGISCPAAVRAARELGVSLA